ncbi:hypothetical protein OBBRIDRAFT_788149 [Obba rivulosa]|uniref:Histone H1 n=1 Tax=Obba rivulosa TaxID=1052685 RepID=A0A8E2J7U2_9APHY|nr:hypothetical protein OBBRIDRAFT_788149 [Obba rivulosa]
MTAATSTRAAKPASKKTKTSKITKPSATKADPKAAAAHPSWKDMIKECITAHPEEARSGVSRATIKKFVSDKYRLDLNNANASQLNRAIAHGAEQGLFSLPKGPSGKVKLAPKTKPAAKENAEPVGAIKPAAAKAASTKAAKSAPAKPIVKKATPAKSRTTKSVASKTSAKPAVMKKPVAKSTKSATTPIAKKTPAKIVKKAAMTKATIPKKTSSARASQKKSVAKAAAAKPRSRTGAKPRSKKTEAS